MPIANRVPREKCGAEGRDLLLETFGILGSDVEGFFEGEACASEGAFVEEAADEGNAVGDAARGRESGEGMRRVGGPVAAGFGDFDETGAEGERRVSGEVRNIEHFVAQGGDEQEIDIVEDAGLLFGNAHNGSLGRPVRSSAT